MIGYTLYITVPSNRLFVDGSFKYSRDTIIILFK